MKEELLSLLDKSYAPYSKFHVSAIIEMKDAIHYCFSMQIKVLFR